MDYAGSIPAKVNMRYQTHNYDCGPFAVFNALRSVGIRANIAKITKLAVTTPAEGTNENGIIAALKFYGIEPRIFASTNSTDLWNELAIKKLHKNKETGDEFNIKFPIIACINNYAHWVVILAYLVDYDRFVIIDSNNTKTNKAENGVHVVTYDTLIRRWYNKNDKRYFGISF